MAGDFDPDKFDNLMHKVFDDEYYGGAAELEKPELSDESDVDENWIQEKEEDEQEEEMTVNNLEKPSSSSCVPSTSAGIQQQKSTKRRRRTQVSEAVNAPKPVFDPSIEFLKNILMNM